MFELVLYGKKHCSVIILEGILNAALERRKCASGGMKKVYCFFAVFINGWLKRDL